MSVKRSRGRPKRSESPIDRKSIIDSAIEQLAEEGQRISVRATARRLNVDPMALYTYFPHREALEEALAAQLMCSLYEPAVSSGWKYELRTLIGSYIDLLLQHRGLLETIVRLGERAEGPAELFRERFMTATAPLSIYRSSANAALELIIGYAHGLVLASERGERGTQISEDASSAIEFYLGCLSSAAAEQDSGEVSAHGYGRRRIDAVRLPATTTR